MSTQSRLDSTTMFNIPWALPFLPCFFPSLLIIPTPHPISYFSSSQPLLPLLPPHASLIGQLVKPQGRVIACCQPRTKSRSHWSAAHKGKRFTLRSKTHARTFLRGFSAGIRERKEVWLRQCRICTSGFTLGLKEKKRKCQTRQGEALSL